MRNPNKIELVVVYQEKAPAPFGVAKYLLGVTPMAVLGILGMVAMGVDPRLATTVMAGFAVVAGGAGGLLAVGMTLAISYTYGEQRKLIEQLGSFIEVSGSSYQPPVH